MAKIKLGIEVSKLYRVETINIAGQSVSIRPLSLRQLAALVSKAQLIANRCAEEGITWENFRQPAKALALAMILVTDFVDVLSEASNIEEEDLQQLPVEIILEIINTVIKVNMDSKDDLAKNFDSLTKMFTGQSVETA